MKVLHETRLEQNNHIPVQSSLSFSLCLRDCIHHIMFRVLIQHIKGDILKGSLLQIKCWLGVEKQETSFNKLPMLMYNLHFKANVKTVPS